MHLRPDTSGMLIGAGTLLSFMFFNLAYGGLLPSAFFAGALASIAYVWVGGKASRDMYLKVSIWAVILAYMVIMVAIGIYAIAYTVSSPDISSDADMAVQVAMTLFIWGTSTALNMAPWGFLTVVGGIITGLLLGTEKAHKPARRR